MKPRLQTSLGQHLVMTPQLRQAIRLLQLSAVELEAELATAVESNPLLDWTETAISASVPTGDEPAAASNDAKPESGNGDDRDDREDWGPNDGEPWYERVGPGDPDDDSPAAEQVAEGESLHDHLLWQLHLSPLSPRDRLIGVALIESIDDDGYLREPLEAIAESLAPGIDARIDEITTVLHQVQRFDPVGAGARSLGECLRLQLSVLPDDTPGKALACDLTQGSALERLPRIGPAGLAAELRRDLGEVETAVQLLRSLDPRPGAQIGAIANDTYVAPDVVIWRQHGLWRVGLADGTRPRVTIHRGYEGMIRGASASDALYLRGHLQGAESKTRAYYDPQVLDRVVGDHVEGRQNHEKLLWALLNLEIWHRQYA